MGHVANRQGLHPTAEELDRQVHAKFEGLRLIVESGQPVLRGTFAVEHASEVLDRFAIEGRFPTGLGGPPLIWETGGRIPRTLARHTYTSGAICVEVPELTLLRGQYSLLGYLDGPVRNYFLSQSLVEMGEGWPFGQWSHRKEGLLEAYGEVLDASGEATIRRYLECLGHKRIKGHWSCPCGSGRTIRNCHRAQIRALRERFPRKIAMSALRRLNSA